MVYSTRRFVLRLTLCYFVLVFFSPFSIAITSLGEDRANLSAFRTFVRFALVWFCLFPLPLGVGEGLRFVIVVLLHFSLTFFFILYESLSDKAIYRNIAVYRHRSSYACAVSSEYLLSIDTFYSIQWFCWHTERGLIRLKILKNK